MNDVDSEVESLAEVKSRVCRGKKGGGKVYPLICVILAKSV